MDSSKLIEEIRLALAQVGTSDSLFEDIASSSSSSSSNSSTLYRNRLFSGSNSNNSTATVASQFNTNMNTSAATPGTNVSNGGSRIAKEHFFVEQSEISSAIDNMSANDVNINRFMPPSVVALMKLNSQVEYNNNLLVQMQGLEQQNADAQRFIRMQQNEIEILSSEVDESKQKTLNIETKLYSAIYLSERLASQNKALQDELFSKSSDLAKSNGELDSYQVRAKEADVEILKLASNIRDLENSLHRAQQSANENREEGNTKLHRLQLKVDKFDKDLKESRIKNALLEGEIISLKDDVLTLNRQKDRQQTLLFEEIALKERKIEECRKLSQDLSAINKKYLDVNIKHSEVIESLDEITLKNNDLTKSAQMALENNEIYESKFKELEEIIHFKTQELTRANARNEELEGIVDSTERRIEKIEQRSRNIEGEDDDRRVKINKNLNERLEEATKLLANSNALLVEEKVKSEEHASKLMGEYYEMNLQMKQMREDHEAKINDFLNNKRELNNKCMNLEVQITDLERDKKRDREIAAAEKNSLEKSISYLKMQLSDTNTSHAGFLNTVSRQIIALRSKSVELSDENTNILIHHNKVCNILHSLIGYNLNASGDSKGTGTSELRDALRSGSIFSSSRTGTPSHRAGTPSHRAADTSNNSIGSQQSSSSSNIANESEPLHASIPPLLRPSVLYGGELRQLVGFLILQSNKLQQENDTLMKTVSLTELELKEKKLQIEGINQDCENFKSQILQLQKTCSSLESQLQGSKESYKVLQTTCNESLAVSSHKENKFKSEIDDLVSQGNSLHGEIISLQKDNLHLKSLNANMTETARQQKKDFEIKTEELEDVLKKSEFQYQSISDEFTKLQIKYKANIKEFVAIKESTSKLTEVIKVENSNFYSQISLLNETIAKMEIQLHQKQLLIDSLQTQRAEMQQYGSHIGLVHTHNYNNGNSSSSGNKINSNNSSNFYSSGNDRNNDDDALAKLYALSGSLSGFVSNPSSSLVNKNLLSSQSSNVDGIQLRRSLGGSSNSSNDNKNSSSNSNSNSPVYFSHLDSRSFDSDEILSIDVKNAQIRHLSNNLSKKN